MDYANKFYPIWGVYERKISNHELRFPTFVRL